MRRGARAALALAAALLALTPGCRKHKPPPMIRAWLGPGQGCALLKEGGVACWGEGSPGQFGGLRESRPVAEPAPIPADVREIAFGDFHACAILGDASVRCWGDGPGATAPPIAGATAIAGGGEGACAATPERVTCWGRPEDRLLPAGRATALAMGKDHACAAYVEPAREVRCAGADEKGQSGGGEALLPGADVVELTAGDAHTCALLRDASILCWGANDAGQLGDATTNDAKKPAPVHGLEGADGIAAGARHTCARLRANTVACWGDNRFHQLADGTTTASSRPVPLHGLVGVKEITAAGDATCARIADGGVRCWGRNDTYQLGDGTTREHVVPMPVKWR